MLFLCCVSMISPLVPRAKWEYREGREVGGNQECCREALIKPEALFVNE